jgi:hypothetical protein
LFLGALRALDREWAMVMDGGHYRCDREYLGGRCSTNNGGPRQVSTRDEASSWREEE